MSMNECLAGAVGAVCCATIAYGRSRGKSLGGASPSLSVEPKPSETVRVSGRKVALYNDEYFAKLRKAHGLDDDFLNHGWDMTKDLKLSDAKGGAVMAFIGSNFVVKDLNKGDHESLLEICERFTTHLQQDGGSLIAPVYLHWKDAETGKIFYCMGCSCPQGPYLSMYDLKGCADDKMIVRDGKKLPVVHKRFYKLCMWGGDCTWSAERHAYFEGKVIARAIKFAMTEEQRAEILKKMKRDLQFMKEANLMDYSLLVVEKEGPVGSFQANTSRLPCQYPLVRKSEDGLQDRATFVGIIDYLQKWNAAKVIAKKIKFMEPNKATIEPTPYADRFYAHFEERLVAGKA